MPEIITPQEILPHPFDPEQRIVPLTVIRAEKRGTEDEPIIRFIATDGSEDRHGSRINPNGWDLSQFKRNPVILWGHNQAIPAIGKGEEISLANGRMELDVRFALEAWDVPGMGNLAMLLYRLASQDFIRAMSTSFIPKAWHDIEAETIPSFFAENVSYDRQEMTENSIVNVPSNRNALKKALSANVISENEATLLGLGAMVRLEMPTMIRTEAGVITPETAATTPAEEPKRVLVVGEFRSKVSDVLTRCCGCEPYYPTKPTIDDDQKAEIVTTLNELAAQSIERLDTAITGWKNADAPEEFRGLCANELYGAMWAFDRCTHLLREWFGEEVGATVPDIDFDDVERAMEGFTRAHTVTIDGAEVKRHLIEALREYESEREIVIPDFNPPTSPIIKIIKNTGDEPREQGSTATFRVLASDASGDRPEDRPAPGDLYRVMLTD